MYDRVYTAMVYAKIHIPLDELYYYLINRSER